MPQIHWDVIGHILVTLLIVSIFYETALSAIFNWRLFKEYLSGKGMKVPVSISIAFAVFWFYDFDLFTGLLNALGYEQTSTIGGKALTALMVAGGSGSINGLLKKFQEARSGGVPPSLSAPKS